MGFCQSFTTNFPSQGPCQRCARANASSEPTRHRELHEHHHWSLCRCLLLTLAEIRHGSLRSVWFSHGSGSHYVWTEILKQAKLGVNQLQFVASLILPNTNPSCKSMVLPRFRTSLNAESTKAASAAFMSAMHLMMSLRAWKFRRGAKDCYDCKV